jgi:hypothetical protein
VTPAEIVTALERHGTRIAVEGERVRLVFNGNAPPDNLVQAARGAKAALQAMIRPTVASGVDTDGRAAAISFGNSAPREWAEALARLDPAQPPADIPNGRWRRFIDDCEVFLDTGWAGRAAALGWVPLELFGCDGAKPFARVSRQGLLWLLNGRLLLALTGDIAAIANSNGGRLTYYRRPPEPGQFLVWELVP